MGVENSCVFGLAMVLLYFCLGWGKNIYLPPMFFELLSNKSKWK